MLSILDTNFEEHYIPSSKEEETYKNLRDQACLAFTNDVLKEKGFISIERLCQIFNVPITAEMIENTSVLRYDGRVLAMTRESIGNYRWRFRFQLVEEPVKLRDGKNAYTVYIDEESGKAMMSDV